MYFRKSCNTFRFFFTKLLEWRISYKVEEVTGFANPELMGRSNIRIAGSNLAWDMYVCVCVCTSASFLCCFVLCK